MKQLYTTINAGKYKNKKILLPSLAVTRSTKSIIKGSYFDTVQFDIIEHDFFEVFGGSGSMGLEALSRGASKAYFIEIDKNSYKVLDTNCKSIAPQDTKTYYGNSFNIYPDVIKNIKDNSFIYLDPPFDIRDGMKNIYENTIKLIENTPKQKASLISIEHISSLELPQNIGVFKKLKTKKFGKSCITHYE